MKTLKLICATVIILPAAALAEAVIEDTNGDGLYSPEEVNAALPEVTEAMFVQMDTNADGALDAEEVAAAVAAGMIAG